ncbi:hypothetical protein llap_19105 [Limosa lapponica baueri]|uniref:Nucleolar protein 6 n=1 Tax=Limosa lapponica baueri TaxID=1758121 RepID=A0A2I0T9W6_LIMLA|nr:hypothetical protein llap_19105 [Limosa lapponica baueri]
MEIFDDWTVDSFQVLLMTVKLMLRAFDHVFLHADIPESSICYTVALLESVIRTGSLEVQFLCFFNLLATFDWKNNPLTVNLNAGLTNANCTEIKNNFESACSCLLVMFVDTPKEWWSSMWTQERPSAQILQLLFMLASESLQALEEQLTDLFNSQDVKATPWGVNTRGYRLWQSILVFGDDQWDVLGGFRLVAMCGSPG